MIMIRMTIRIVMTTLTRMIPLAMMMMSRRRRRRRARTRMMMLRITVMFTVEALNWLKAIIVRGDSQFTSITCDLFQ